MSIPQTEAMQLIASYNQASDLFSKALIAIREARRDGRISDEIARVREQHLTERFGVQKDADGQIAVCQAMLRACEASHV